MPDADAGSVLLVHGLWMNAAAMLPLAWRMQGAGLRVARFAYRSVRNGMEENAGQLALACGQHPQPVSLVGHSLGGLTVLHALHLHPGLAVRRVVLLGVPYAGIGAAQRLTQFEFGRRIVGRAILDAIRRPAPPPPPGVEIGVIAGDVPVGMGRVVAQLQGPNDGVVLVSETRVPGAADSRTVHVSHSGMLVSAPVARLTAAFLRKGRFDDA